MDIPLVSISCLTYNHASFLRQCLDGFMMQDCNFKFEVLIHDDASTDGTREIIKDYQAKYPDIIKPIFQTENQYSQGLRGIMARFNFPRAKGKYIALCEGDDYWTDPHKLQKQVNFLESHPNVMVCGTNYQTSTDGKIEDRIRTKETKVFSRELLLHDNMIPTLTAVFRNPDFDIKIPRKICYADWYLWVYLTQKANADFAILEEITALQNIHQNGVYSSITNEAKLQLNAMILKGSFSSIVKHRNKKLLNDLFSFYWNISRYYSDYRHLIKKNAVHFRFYKYKILRKLK